MQNTHHSCMHTCQHHTQHTTCQHTHIHAHLPTPYTHTTHTTIHTHHLPKHTSMHTCLHPNPHTHTHRTHTTPVFKLTPAGPDPSSASSSFPFIACVRCAARSSLCVYCVVCVRVCNFSVCACEITYNKHNVGQKKLLCMRYLLCVLCECCVCAYLLCICACCQCAVYVVCLHVCVLMMYTHVTKHSLPPCIKKRSTILCTCLNELTFIFHILSPLTSSHTLASMHPLHPSHA
jgi:hypothetical protein